MISESEISGHSPAQPRWWLFPLATWFAHRAALFVLVRMWQRLDGEVQRKAQGAWSTVALMCGWDCGWYEGIARDGYRDIPQANFFPLFPLVGRAFHWVSTLPENASLVIVANLAGLIGLLIVYRVFLAVASEEDARVGLLLLVSFPFSFFHAAGYTESFMLVSTGLAMWLALRGRHIWAGVALGVGGLARHMSMVAGLGLVAFQARERGFRPKALFHRDTLGLIIPLFCFAAYPIFLWTRFHNPWLFWSLHKGNDWQTANLIEMFTRDWWAEVVYYVWFGFIPLIGSFLLLRRRDWRPLAAFAIGFCVVVYSIGAYRAGRYTSTAWPAFLGLGAFLRPSKLELPVLVAFALLQGALVSLFLKGVPLN